MLIAGCGKYKYIVYRSLYDSPCLNSAVHLGQHVINHGCVMFRSLYRSRIICILICQVFGICTAQYEFIIRQIISRFYLVYNDNNNHLKYDLKWRVTGHILFVYLYFRYFESIKMESVQLNIMNSSYAKSYPDFVWS